MKNYIGFVNDHSGSMQGLKKAAVSDYNANITATKDAASREMLDTVVSVVGLGCTDGRDKRQNVERQVVISNPHVLRPITDWDTPGHSTPLWDGVGEMIELFQSLPDYNSPDVSFLILTTTDGGENASQNYSERKLAEKIKELQNSDRWTFVFRVPSGHRGQLVGLGVPADNIQEWETTTAGMAASTVQTTKAMDNYFVGRSAGLKSSTVFYANASSVDTSKLKDITKEVSLYVVPDRESDNGVEIKPFILRHRMKFLKGAAFYQLTKTESRISPTKMIAVRNKHTGKIYAGKEARQMIGLSTTNNARLHPGDHGNFDLFIQSESTNRKLVKGTGVIYWEEAAKGISQEDAPYEIKKDANGVVQLPVVPVSNKPTASPIPKAHKPQQPTVNGKAVQFFATRDEARATRKSVQDAIHWNMSSNVTQGQRWFVFI